MYFNVHTPPSPDLLASWVNTDLPEQKLPPIHSRLLSDKLATWAWNAYSDLWYNIQVEKCTENPQAHISQIAQQQITTPNITNSRSLFGHSTNNGT